MILLNIGGEIFALIIGVLIIWILLPVVLIILGFLKLKSKPERAKVMFTIAALILLIGGGICGSMLS